MPIDKTTGIDWGKYGATTKQKDTNQVDETTGINWSKYQTQETPKSNGPELIPYDPNTIVSSEDILNRNNPDAKKRLESGYFGTLSPQEQQNIVKNAQKDDKQSKSKLNADLRHGFGAGRMAPWATDALQGLSNIVVNATNNAALGIPDAATGGFISDRPQYEQFGSGVGKLVGDVVPFGAAYKTTAGLTRGLVENAPKVVGSLAKGATAGAAFGAAKEALDATGLGGYGDGNQTLGERALRVGETAVLGGGLDAGFSLAGSALKKLTGTKIGDAVQNFFTKNDPSTSTSSTVNGLKTRSNPNESLINDYHASSKIIDDYESQLRNKYGENFWDQMTKAENRQHDRFFKTWDRLNTKLDQQGINPNNLSSTGQQTQGTLALPPAARYDRVKSGSEGTVLPANETPIYANGKVEPLGLPQGNYTPPQRYRVLNQEEAFARAYEKVLPAATERMTPPLENPDELAKWVHGHLKGSGFDISLNEVKKAGYEDLRQMSEMIRNKLNPLDVVRKTAYDMGYGGTFDKTTPSIKEKMAQDLEKQKYGIYPDKVNIQRPDNFNVIHENPAAAPQTTVQIKQQVQPRVPLDTAPVRQEPIAVQNAPIQSGQPVNTQPIANEIRIPQTPQEEAILHADTRPAEPRMRDNVVSYMEEQANAARARIKSNRNRLSSNPLDDWADRVVIGTYHIVKNGVKFVDFAQAMIHEFGDEIRPQLAQLYRDSIQAAKSAAKLTEKDLQRARNMAKFEENNQTPGIADTSTHIVSKTKREATSFGDKVTATVQKTTDNLYSMKKMGKDVEDITGIKLSGREDAHKLALNSRNSDIVSNQIIIKNLVDSDGNVIGDSLKEIMKDIKDKQQYNAFTDYLVNKHAPTRMERGETVFPDYMKMSPAKSRAKAAEYEAQFPHFVDTATKLYDFQNKLGQAWLVDTGIITQDAWNGYLKANPYYVPNSRLFTSLEKGSNGKGKGKGFANQPKQINEGTGSERPIIDPIESIIEHVAQYVKTSKETQAMQALVRYIDKEPDALVGWAEIVGREKSNADELLQTEGVDGVLGDLSKSFENAMKKNDLTRDNIVYTMVDGSKVHIRVNDANLLNAIAQLPKQTHGPLLNFVGQITRILKLFTTGINPVFSLTRNILKDIPSAYFNSKTTNNPLVFAKDMLSSFVDVFGNRAAYQSYKNVGGGHSSPIAANRNLLKQSKSKVIPAQNGYQVVKKAGGRIVSTLENLNNAIESAPRLAEFKRTLKKTGDKQEALFQANDVTVNFNKYGSITREFDVFLPYLNAAVQGLTKTARTYAQNPVRAGIKSVIGITIPTILLYMVNHDDPNYQQTSSYNKDNFYLIPRGDGTFFKVPKPRETGVAFGSLIERSLGQWKDNDPKAFKDFSTTVINNFAPPGISGLLKEKKVIGVLEDTIAGPIIGVAQNKDFVGRPIVPANLAGLSPANQVDTNTSEIAKILGEKLNKSPKEIDYLIKSYTGVLGQLGLPATTKGNTIVDTLQRQVTADPVYATDTMNEFYAKKGALDTAQRDFKATGNKPKDYNDGQRLYMNNIADSITKVRDRSKALVKNDSMTNAQKKQKQRELQIMMNEMAKKALVRVNGAAQ